ncbi:DNA invertase Pin-like site-specific DNA recombinase [Actinoplanes campanulatus]|uniref:DNA invertase Pin-like site-specific DNA recombinase n=1 Tax=Actinoplanes campanulatus TaxID=113559 RepID=A0A7W5AN60_9ACTN|nr:recombinase family protein [Actinoplanes campanulatus]MBB3099363.1 DNA invertase Pin-like site-specific DNA recombinase [Actinoplanes campanulatus]
MRIGQPGMQAAIPRVIIYLRMSLDKTGEGAGLERQEQACRALCLARGWEVVAVVEDTVSATDWRLADRAGWSQVVTAIEAGEADLVVAWHLDRVTRDMRDLEALIELAIDKGIGLATATGDIDLTTDVGRMVARILAAVATAEGERKAERQILASDQRVARGKPNWIRRPFGFNKDGTHVPDEAAAIKQAYYDLVKGKALTAIAADWNEKGFRTSAPSEEEARPRAPRQRAYNPTGLWGNVAVRLLLRNPRNMGMITLYGEIMGKGSWKPIIDEATFLKVDKLLADRQRPESLKGKLANLLSGIAECGVCGGPVQATKRNDEPLYTCKGNKWKPEEGRGHTSLPLDYAEGLVLRRLVEQMKRTNRVSFHPMPTGVDVSPLEARERAIDKRLNELIVEEVTGKITRQQLHAGTAELRHELAGIQMEIARAGSFGPVKTIDIEAAYEEFGALDLGEQRGILSDAFQFIRLIQRGRGRPRAGEPIWKPEHLETEFTPEWQRVFEPKA